jgi:hypothetical protein
MSFRPLVAFALLVVFVLVMVFAEGPGLVRDVLLRNAALVPARDYKIEQAQCVSVWLIVSNCSVSYSAPQQRERQSISFSVFGSLHGERVLLLRTADNRTVTTNVGIAKLANRVTTAIVFLLGFATIAFFAARRVLQMA